MILKTKVTHVIDQIQLDFWETWNLGYCAPKETISERCYTPSKD